MIIFLILNDVVTDLSNTSPLQNARVSVFFRFCFFCFWCLLGDIRVAMNSSSSKTAWTTLKSVITINEKEPSSRCAATLSPSSEWDLAISGKFFFDLAVRDYWLLRAIIYTVYIRYIYCKSAARWHWYAVVLWSNCFFLVVHFSSMINGQ